MAMSAAAEATARQNLVKWAMWGVAHEPQIHYSEGVARDDWLQKKSLTLPLTTDCSGFVTLCYWASGLQDPNGLSYRYLGYTGTLLSNCRHIKPKAAKIGDIIVYGPGTGHHAVIIVGQQPDGSLKVVSHGWEGGPQLDLNYKEAAGQPAPITFLRSPQFAL